MRICAAAMVLNMVRLRLCPSRKTEIKKSIQPFLLCIGTAVDNITEIYIYFDQIKYSFKLFRRAADILFKIFHLFNLKYPEACLTFWTFVEKYFFNMDPSETFPRVELLVDYLKK